MSMKGDLPACRTCSPAPSGRGSRGLLAGGGIDVAGLDAGRDVPARGLFALRDALRCGRRRHRAALIVPRRRGHAHAALHAELVQAIACRAQRGDGDYADHRLRVSFELPCAVRRNQVLELRPHAARFHLEPKALQAHIDFHRDALRARRSTSALPPRYAASAARVRSADKRDNASCRSAQAVASALPLQQPRANIGDVLARGFLALRLQLIDHRQLCRELAVLPIPAIELPGNREVDRNMFEYAGPRWLYISSAAPVGAACSPARSRPRRAPPVPACSSNSICGWCATWSSSLAQSTLRASVFGAAPSGRFAASPTQRASRVDRGRDLAIGLRDAVVELRHHHARGEHIGLRAASAAIRCIGRLDLQPRFIALRDQRVAHALLVVAIEPGERGVALQIGERRRAAGLRSFGFALEARCTRLALVAARELLHHADRAHRHEVARQAEAIRAVDRQVVDTRRQRRIGQLRRQPPPSRVRMTRRNPVPPVGASAPAPGAALDRTSVWVARGPPSQPT